MTSQKPLLEICVDTINAARAAAEGGADRIELCAALEVGGLTPSIGLAAVAMGLNVPVRALIRPRAGNFVFDESEERAMREDIERLLALGIEGVVLGASHADGRLNVDVLDRLIGTARAAGARGLTLHRAIDLAPDWEQAIDQAAQLGFDTVLSSGGALTAAEGAAMLARMRKRAPASLIIMAGSGVTPSTVDALLATSGVTAVHASARSNARSSEAKLVKLGFAPAVERSADAQSVRALREALDEPREAAIDD